MPVLSLEEFGAKTYDFLIVGGGTAGLTLATRLSEDPSLEIGVLEAGAYHKDVPGIDVPGMLGTLIGNPMYDWFFMTVPQTHVNNRVLPQPRGKALGGSSMLNFHMWCRASAGEYDAIGALNDDPTWNWAEFVKYTKKAETTVPPREFVDKKYVPDKPLDPAFHGYDGPLRKTTPTHYHDFHDSLVSSLNALGVPTNPDGEHGDNLGVMTMHVAIDPQTATRSYAANAYYEPNASRPNLSILLDAQATKVLTEPSKSGADGSGQVTATGISFVTKDGASHVVRGRQVVLSTGTFQTPHLLELSGIGSQERLSKLGIQPVLDLPGVGENLQDHAQTFSIYEVDPKHETLEIMKDPEQAARQQALYAKQQGFLSTILASSFAFVPASKIADPAQVAAWKAMVKPEESTEPGRAKLLKLQKDWFDDDSRAIVEVMPLPGCYFDPSIQAVPGSRYFSHLAALARPFSRGSVHATSADPLTPPAIDPNYYSNPVDLEVLAAGLKLAMKAMETEPMKSATIKRFHPKDEDMENEETFKNYVKNTTGCVYHPVGTAAMLPREDGGVVSPQLLVYGTSNLRIVDASIIPIIPACHTQSAVYAIAEKAADIFKSLRQSSSTYSAESLGSRLGMRLPS